MAKSPQLGEFLVDGIGTLDAGMNAALAPQLIEKNQAAFATNATFRGGYGTRRPAFREIILDFKGNATLEDLCIHQNFQGACFYQPDTGAQSLVAAIGGRLFQFFPSGNTSPVLDVTPPNDPNPTTPQQAWLWQSEQFVIWNDGVSLPIFFNGSTSRRSNGSHVTLATLDGSYVAPAVGATITVLLTEIYTGPLNVPVLINGVQWVVLSVGATAQSAVVKKYYDPAPAFTTKPAGTAIIAYPNRVGTLLQDIGRVSTQQTVRTSFLVDVNNNPVTTVGTHVIIGGVEFIFGGSTPLNPTDIQGLQNTRLTAVTPPKPSPQGLPLVTAGNIVTIVSSAPIVTVGNLATDFIVTENVQVDSPANEVDIAVSPTFTGAPQVIWMGSGQYLISPKPSIPTNSIVIKNVGAMPGSVVNGDIIGLPELPAGRMGTYGLGRNWMALTDGLTFIASDIVGGTSGTAVYNFRDAPLRVTENTYLAGGGAFRVPGAVGNIQAMRFAATLDVSLGQGPLQVFTTQSVFSCNAPVDRTTWSTITNPILTQSLLGSGASSQDATINFNSDIVFRAIDGIRSLILARRDFDTWGNVPQSREVETILQQDNADFVQFESEVSFDNRLLLTCTPTSGSLGVFHQGLIALNADPISTLRGKAPSIYDGFWTGLNIFKVVKGIFNGVERCYTFCFDVLLNRIRLFEIQKTDAALFDNDTTPITYSFESASLFSDKKMKGEFDLVELVDGEIYISDLRGVANFQVWWRNSYSDCWYKWTEFGVCGNNTLTSKPKQYRAPIGLGSPSVTICDPNTKTPARIGLNFQVRFQITGSCKFRGAKFKAVMVPETMYTAAACKPLCEVVSDSAVECEECVDIDQCIQFPLVLYNLNANKFYQNDGQEVTVTCPDGTQQSIFVPAGSVTYALPFPVGYTGDYPPLILNCADGSVVVRTIPSGATQEQIDAVVAEMIAACVQAYALSISTC